MLVPLSTGLRCRTKQHTHHVSISRPVDFVWILISPAMFPVVSQERHPFAPEFPQSLIWSFCL